jgi:sec-independent protein translocase protein TatA
MFGLSELAIALVVVAVVIGAKRLPDLARSAGKSARILKSEARAAKDEQPGDGQGAAPRVIQGEVITPATGAPAGPASPAAGQPSGPDGTPRQDGSR